MDDPSVILTKIIRTRGETRDTGGTIDRINEAGGGRATAARIAGNIFQLPSENGKQKHYTRSAWSAISVFTGGDSAEKIKAESKSNLLVGA